ncbi:immunoglobulin superfamily member 10 [Eublepharis macularius]|uniref:immunoglobulin superfamily member 10 n=1 Tax=Eublepharis macularius TaxID=481883 RepID=UPI00240EB759|nr:immunoglobulin superfamily member 10 [Eublepharis macularius]
MMCAIVLFSKVARDADLGLSRRRQAMGKPALLGFLFGFCFAALAGSSACPKLCACYVPTEVHCTFRYFSSIPPQISQEVERINLGYNSLVKLTETDFSGLEKLELLMLHSNQIHTIQDRTFSDLRSLQILKMSYNRVKVVQADTFHGLTSLVRLHMDHNQIEFVSPKAFYGLTSLRLVHLEGNVLKQLHPDTFVTLRYIRIFKTSSIKHIYLSDNFLTSLPQDIFSYMSELESLYLHGNPWTCDCALKWFAEWAEHHKDVVKCKKDRGPSGTLQCPLCSSPKNCKDKPFVEIPSPDFNCVKPTIDPVLKFKNITVPDDGDFTIVSSKDFIAPIGSIMLNMTDQAGNQASLVCSVQKPTKMPPVQLEKNDNTVLEASLSTFLVCSIDYEHIQQLWSILALYSDSPLRLKRDLLLTKVPYISYKYKQMDSENEDIFTNIEAEMRAEPAWLMQGLVSLQLDRTATTLNTLHIQYSVDARITLPVIASPTKIQNWALMLRVNSTRTEHTVLAGQSVELDCQALGDPTPIIEWVLPDGSKVRAPYVSEDGRIVIAKTGKFILRTADNFDTGVYHCIGTNYDDADVLSFRITVIDPYMEHNYVNGRQLSAFLGETLFLPCQSVGVPDASVNWVLPEHVVLHDSSRTKKLFHNGTLKIQLTNDRDGGYYKCIAANQYGVDFLVHEVLVKKNSSRSQKLEDHEEAAEGSGNGELDIIARTQSPPSAVPHEAARRTATEVLLTNHPKLKRTNIKYREIYKHNRDKMTRRFRGHRKQFSPSTRRIDPLRWAAFLEKTKNITLPRKHENAMTKPTVKVLLSSKTSENERELSGEIPPEEEFLLLVTKRPAMYMLGEASGSVVTAEPGSISSNFHSTAAFGIAMETVTPLGTPMVTHSEGLRSQESYTELKPEVTRGSLEALQPAPTSMGSSSPSSYLPSNATDLLNTFPSRENDLHLKMTPTVTPAMQITRNTSPVTSHRVTKKTNLFVESTDKTSRKSNHQTSVVTVTAPDDLFGHIYVYSSQKITTPQLPAGSTIVTHQRIKIVRDTTPRVPLSRRYGRRKKTFARRRIVRPDHIPNKAGHRFAFIQPRIAKESTTLPPPVKVNTSTLTPPNKSHENVTFQVPIASSFRTHHPEATTVNPIVTISFNPGNKPVTAEEHTTSTAIPFYPENTQIVPQRQGETSVPLHTITDTYSSFSSSLPVETIHTPSVALESTFTTGRASLSNIKSIHPTLSAHLSPSVSAGKIFWHVPNFFRSNHFQKELLEKQPRLRTSEEPSPKEPVTSSQTTGTIPTLRSLPVHVTAVSKQENQTDGLRNLILPVSDSTGLEEHAPTRPLNVTESPTLASLPSLAAPLSKDIHGTSIKPVLTPPTAVHVKTKVSRIRVLRPGRRNQRRKRPLRRLMPPQKNITVNAYLSKGTGASPSLAADKKVTESILPKSTELHSRYSGRNILATTLQLPILHTASTIRGTSTSAPQLLTRNTTAENFLSTKLPVYSGPSQKPAIAIPLTLSSLNISSITTVLSATSLLTPESTELTQTTSVANKELYQNTRRIPAYKKLTTEAALSATAELSTKSPSDAVFPITQQRSQLTSQTLVTPVTQIISSPRLRGKFWHSELAESGKTFLVNTLTILNSLQSFTQHTPIWEEKKNNFLRSWSDKTANQETTTANLVGLESFYHSRLAKPRIIGGKLAAFTVLANSDAFIPCEATGNPRPTIHWTKISSEAEALKQKRENRFEVLRNGTLSIENVSIQDRGQYLCVAANQHGSDRLLITLSVVAYPPRILGGRSKIITVHSGKPVSMKCTTEGRPTPTISWILANKTYISDSSVGNKVAFVQADGTLMMKKVSVYDRGLYTCMASNPAGSDTMTIRLQVIAAPPIILEEKRQHVLVSVGESLKLPCSVEGSPHPNVHWVLFDGTVVKPLQYINGKLFLFPNGTLYLRNVAVSDRGKYECIATSSTGSERRVVILQVEHSDTIPRIAAASQRLTQLNFGDRLLLNCSAVGEPKPRIIWRLPSKAVVDQWHRMGSRIHVHPNGSLVIDAITEKDAGNYLCVARNKMGDDLILMKVSVTMKPAKIDQKQYFKKLVPYGKDFKVDCKASGSPEPEISWSLPDGTVINNVMQADDSGHRSRRYILFDNGTLYLNKVGIAEEGDYTCYAQNTLGKDEMKVHITVVAAAPRIKQNAKTYSKVKAGDTATFDCEAIGQPKPKIFWLLPSSDMISASNNRYFLHVNGSLSVTKVRLLDAGEYICVARNSGGDDTKLYKLDVVSKPPLINGLFTNKTVIKTTAIKYSKKQIDCRAEGTPPPQIMWIMPDNIFLTAPFYGSRITVHNNGTLDIRNVRSSDTAEFICVARNDGGESILVVQLEVLEMLRRPVFKNPFNEKVVAKAGKTTLLNCSVDGNPPPEIIWMLPNGTRLFRGVRTLQYYLGSNGTLIVYSPSKADAGKYRCAAKNKVGYIEKLIVLEVGQKPTIFTPSGGAIKSISGESVSLHCLAAGNPKPSIIWTAPSGSVLDRPQINGRYTLMENGTLVIRETTIHDRGSYVCKAQNYAGDSSIVVFVMVIAHPPRITNRPPRNIRTVAGVSVQLNCMALGIPNPEITWELPDHSLLSTGSKGRPSGSELLHPQGTLIIQNPRSSDSGIYKCMAKNQLGTDSTVTFVQVI